MNTAKIQTINDLAKAKQFDSEEDLAKFLLTEVYPVTIESSEEALTIRTDADRVPFIKTLCYPFTEDDFDNAMIGLQCVTDYAMHEGYAHTHKDLFNDIALRYAEKIGVYEYQVNGCYMEYWSMFDEGFYFFRTNLNTLEREEVCHLPWVNNDEIPVPAFLKTPEGYTKYNYFCG